ncbi:MAG: hypothetical protein KGZ39_04360 [Simkania sp.]|nr:hypothetical protein [Simkania sp.]
MNTIVPHSLKKEEVMTNRFAMMFATLLAVTPLVCNEEIGVQEVQVYFSPRDRVDEKLISLIEKEPTSIKAAVYCLTHRGVIKALMDAQKRGVKVEIVIDRYTIRSRAPLKRMAQTGMMIHVWDPQVKPTSDKNQPSLMHNKFCILSGQGVTWTGSFNFTSEGSMVNQENVVLLRDEKSKTMFEEQFAKIRKEGCRSWADYLSNPPKKQKKKQS